MRKIIAKALFDLGHKKTITQAVIFYVFYGLFLTILPQLVNRFLQLVYPQIFTNDMLPEWLFFENFFCCTFLEGLLIERKNWFFSKKHYGGTMLHTLLFLGALVLLCFYGIFLGLIPIAYLTTFSKWKKSDIYSWGNRVT